MSRYATLDRNKAVEYALAHAEDPNYIDFGYFFPLGDCTNFVSQCWNYAGIPQKNGWYFNSMTDYAKSWSVVEDFGNYMTYYSSLFMEDNEAVAVYKWSSNEVKPGDIIQFSKENDEKGNPIWHHSAIITNIENGEIYYAQHSKDLKNVALSSQYPNPEKLVRFICPIYATY